MSDDPLLTAEQIREVEYERARYLADESDVFEFEACLDEILFPERHPELGLDGIQWIRAFDRVKV